MYKYIVANKGQELDVLGELEKEGFVWVNTHSRPTSLLVSESDFVEFPYVIITDSRRMTIEWSTVEAEFNGDVFFDGREELNMKKYKVTKKFMDKLVAWRDKFVLKPDLTYRSSFVSGRDISDFPYVVDDWWIEDKNPIERNNRLIAIISWLNGKDVFEVEEPNKFVIRSEKPNWDGDYWFVRFKEGMDDTTTHLSKASKFDTYEEAKEWANSHQVVVGVGSEG